ncbi:MAG: hypothetical protein OHK0040_03410 [bacterium]
MKKTLITFFLLFLPALVFSQQMHKGIVLQTMNVEGYTYMEIKDGNVTKWIACPTLEVKKGDTVETSFGMLMPDFESKSLKRTFKEIYFVTWARVVSPAQDYSKKQKSATSLQKPKGKYYTVSEIIENKDSLTDKTVLFKAKVTKYTPSIMGKNWLHVTDQTESNNNVDLVVTTSDTTTAGEIVKVEGKLTTNKNIGSGYFFPIIVEDAKVSPLKE